MSEAHNKCVSILLVEDDQVDSRAFLRAMQKLRISNPVTIARDGQEAWEILKGTEGRPRLARPNLIILDLNMPRISGLELLRMIRNDAELHDSIVFVLTTSDDEQDKLDAYELNISGYMLKSDVGGTFMRAVEMVDRFWRVVEFPGVREGVAPQIDRRQYARHPPPAGLL
ncbi:MAG: response regulator [Chromatiales bacterium]|nr:response regulator [Chromatiales bacterium]